MSYNNKSNGTKKFASASNGNKKPFCKVCHDAGKTESEYTSHFVRSLPDMNGKTKITCPILAATECRYCYELGHTTKFCPILEENNKRSKKEKSVSIQYQRAEQRAYSRPIPEPVVEKKYSGAFAALGDDSEESEKPVAKVAVVDEFPALFGSKTALAKGSPDGLKSAVSWAAMAEKPAAPVLKPIVKPVIKNTPQIAGKSWADDSDSEEEEEEFQSAPLVRTDSVYNAPCYARASADDDDW
jgi:hypothetical protein